MNRYEKALYRALMDALHSEDDTEPHYKSGKGVGERWRQRGERSEGKDSGGSKKYSGGKLVG